MTDTPITNARLPAARLTKIEKAIKDGQNSFGPETVIELISENRQLSASLANCETKIAELKQRPTRSEYNDAMESLVADRDRLIAERDAAIAKADGYKNLARRLIARLSGKDSQIVAGLRARIADLEARFAIGADGSVTSAALERAKAAFGEYFPKTVLLPEFYVAIRAAIVASRSPAPVEKKKEE